MREKPGAQGSRQLEELLHQGLTAFNRGDYRGAAGYYRRAVRRAPFRQDIRQALAASIEAAVNSGRRMGSRRGRSVPSLAAITLEPVGADEPTAAPPATSPAPEAKPRPGAPTATSDFEKRHRRGPLSALLLGSLVGLVLVVGLVGLLLFYLGFLRGEGPDTADSLLTRARYNNIIAQARVYKQQGDYSLAIEQLHKLPEGPVRSRMLAETYLEQGDQNFHQDPPKLEAAIYAYRQSVEHRPGDPEYAKALALAYYTLGRLEPPEQAEQTEQYFEHARRIYENVLDQRPGDLEALKGLAKVGIATHNDTLAARCWHRIIEVAPDSPAAAAARDHLRSRRIRP